MTSTNFPAPIPEPGENGSEGALAKLIDRLPAEISPGYFLGALAILVLGVIGIAYVAGLWLAAAGGLLGLATLVAAFRKGQ